MNRLASFLFLAVATFATMTAQNSDGFQFTTVKEAPITSIKNQNRSGTCWAYSSLAFFESELLRLGKGTHELSRMFVVHHTYQDRAVNYVRFHGEAPLGQGGSFYDVLYCLRNYGIVPQDVYIGIQYGDSLPNFNDFYPVVESITQTWGKSKARVLSPLWRQTVVGVLDTYLGALPEQFSYNGKDYTPQSYAASLGLPLDEYINLTSYTHHPFYTQFPLEIPDNWRAGLSYNIPIDELMAVIDNAVDKGYTVAWGSDVSEAGFSNAGVAVMPDIKAEGSLEGSDAARWLGLTQAQRSREGTTSPAPEIWCTQEQRQEAYDNWETTDDHGMLIYGVAKDQTGKPYYMVKNSWGTSSKYQGIWYASRAFTRYKTMNILVHKDAIPRAIRNKLRVK